jgi:hypothetical protein
MKVGMSFSFCVKDILEGRIQQEEVAFIYTATRCETSKHWEEVIRQYRLRYWKDNPDKAEEIARYFINNSLVIQPRLEGKVVRCRRRIIWIDQDDFNQFVFDNLEDDWTGKKVNA